MNNLRAFIDRITTVDYSYFWPYMEVLTSSIETKATGEENSVMHWPSATFGPFSETEQGIAYAKKFAGRYQETDLSPKLIQDATTDLLTLPSDQVQLHVNRLNNLSNIWLYQDDIGIRSEGFVFEEYTLPLEGLLLATLSFFLNDNALCEQNIPVGSDKIYLRRKFFRSFISYIIDA